MTNEDIKRIETPIEEFIESNAKVKTNDWVSNCHVFIDDYKTSHYNGEYDASYLISLGDFNGQKLNQAFKLSHGGLLNLMNCIQNNKLKRFSEVYLLMLEEIAKYNKGQDIHYYLKVLLESPGVTPAIPKVKKKIPSCKECNSMLLRYGFKWKIQRNDLVEKICPYCNKPLTVENRERKLIRVKLNFDEESCVINQTRAQIGIIYNNQALKSTINPRGIFNFLQNYQHNFKTTGIGPFSLKFRNGRPLYVNELTPGAVATSLEWRPALLFPEDFIAF